MTKLPSIDQNISPMEGDLSENKKDQESQQFEKETTKTTKETSFQLSELKKQLKNKENNQSLTQVDHLSDNNKVDDANKFLETELEKIDVQTSKLESNEKESHTQKSKHKAQSVELQQKIAENTFIAHKAIEDLGRPEATQWLKDSYDEAQNTVTDLMWMFLSDKNLGFFS